MYSYIAGTGGWAWDWGSSWGTTLGKGINKGFSRPRHLQGKGCKTGLCGQAWSFPLFDGPYVKRPTLSICHSSSRSPYKKLKL